MATQILLRTNPVLDSNGDPVAGAKVTTYVAGATTTPLTTYSDNALATANANPVVADANGVVAQIFTSATGAAIYVTDADDNELYTYNYAPTASSSAQTAASTSSTAFSGVASTNVQDALEEIQGNIDDLTLADLAATEAANDLSGDTVAAATTTARGTVELATNAEGITGTDTSRAMTPAATKAAYDAQPNGWTFVETIFDSGEGTSASATTSAFADNFEYAIAFRNVSHNDGSSQVLNMTLTWATDGAATAVPITAAVAGAETQSGWIEFRFTRSGGVAFVIADGWLLASGDLTTNVGSASADSYLGTNGIVRGWWNSASGTTDKINTVSFAFASGSLDGGLISVFRRSA